MIGLVFFNALNTRVRIVIHQLETIKIMLLNRFDQLDVSSSNRGQVELIRSQARG
jgi:biopolymer transport protein ExbB